MKTELTFSYAPKLLKKPDNLLDAFPVNLKITVESKPEVTKAVTKGIRDFCNHKKLVGQNHRFVTLISCVGFFMSIG